LNGFQAWAEQTFRYLNLRTDNTTLLWDWEQENSLASPSLMGSGISENPLTEATKKLNTSKQVAQLIMFGSYYTVF